jgi:hypothetical protein
LSSLAIFTFFQAKPWNPDSYYWHSDVLWSVAYMPAPVSLELQKLNHARDEAQSRYEAPMAAAFSANALATLVASLGLFFRKNWARLLIIAVLAIAMLELTLMTWLFWSLRMHDVHYINAFAIIAVLGLIAWTFRAPSIVSEFRNARA